MFWAALEYLALFVIVLLHEFGHALACRQVGGKADQIVLWPLGGVAYVAPPPRPGATLWSIAAGPLVNVVLLPLFIVFLVTAQSFGWQSMQPNAYEFLRTLCIINIGLLVFNLLPIYPLDGGQILRAVLWFGLGRARSLMVATVIGFVGVAGLIALAVWVRSVWFGILSAFILMNCWRGLLQARALSRLARMPRHEGFVCPDCGAAPPIGPLWLCGQCRKPFDAIATQAVCPHCGAQFGVGQCLDCGAVHPINTWVTTPAVPPPLPH
jgi:Zn-dependent protease